MKGIIDRFEGNYAVVEFEHRKMQNILRSALPEVAKEGDVIVSVNGKFEIDLAETTKRKNEIAQLSENIWE